MSAFNKEVFISNPGNIKNGHPGIVLNVIQHNASFCNPTFTIKFNGWNSKLVCEEQGDKKGNLQTFHYNWYNDDGSLIMKFHNHNHDKYPDALPEVTQYDPVHLQFPLLPEDNNNLPDIEGKIRDHSIYESLDDVLDFLENLQRIEARKH